MDKHELIELSSNPNGFLKKISDDLIYGENEEVINLVKDAYNAGQLPLLEILIESSEDEDKPSFYEQGRLIEKLLPELSLSLNDANRLMNFIVCNEIHLSTEAYDNFERNISGIKNKGEITEWILSAPDDRNNLILPILSSKDISSEDRDNLFLLPLLNSTHSGVIFKCLIYLDVNHIQKETIYTKLIDIIESTEIVKTKEKAASALVNFIQDKLITTNEIIEKIEKTLMIILIFSLTAFSIKRQIQKVN